MFYNLMHFKTASLLEFSPKFEFFCWNSVPDGHAYQLGQRSGDITRHCGVEEESAIEGKEKGWGAPSPRDCLWVKEHQSQWLIRISSSPSRPPPSCFTRQQHYTWTPIKFHTYISSILDSPSSSNHSTDNDHCSIWLYPRKLMWFIHRGLNGLATWLLTGFPFIPIPWLMAHSLHVLPLLDPIFSWEGFSLPQCPEAPPSPSKLVLIIPEWETMSFPVIWGWGSPPLNGQRRMCWNVFVFWECVGIQCHMVLDRFLPIWKIFLSTC